MRRIAAAVLLGLLAASPAVAQAPCWVLANEHALPRHVHNWNTRFNRDAAGKPILATYDQAARLIEAGQRSAALKLLDEAARSTEDAALKVGLPTGAEVSAELIRSCPAWFSPETR